MDVIIACDAWHYDDSPANLIHLVDIDCAKSMASLSVLCLVSVTSSLIPGSSTQHLYLSSLVIDAEFLDTVAICNLPRNNFIICGPYLGSTFLQSITSPQSILLRNNAPTIDATSMNTAMRSTPIFMISLSIGGCHLMNQHTGKARARHIMYTAKRHNHAKRNRFIYSPHHQQAI